MANRMPGKCPVCGDELHVARLHCTNCGTGLDGSFQMCKFCRLSKEQLEFVEVFLASRGNIKEVERLLGISYPTVRNRLDNVIESLGYKVERQSTLVNDAKRREVLELLDKGELSAADAVRMLREQ